LKDVESMGMNATIDRDLLPPRLLPMERNDAD
jgi:hypothetical protein